MAGSGARLKECPAGGGLLSPLLAFLRARAVARHLAGPRVLDCGCGMAPLLRFLRWDQTYVGVDRNVSLVQSLRLSHPARIFHCVDLNFLELPEPREVDTIVLAAVVEHLERPLDVIQRLVERLRPGGRLILTTPHPIAVSILSVGAWLRILSPRAHEEHGRLLGRVELLGLLREAGLSPVVYRRFLLGLNQLVVAAR